MLLRPLGSTYSPARIHACQSFDYAVSATTSSCRQTYRTQQTKPATPRSRTSPRQIRDSSALELLLRCGRTLPRHRLLDPPLNVDPLLFPCHISLLGLITRESFVLASYAINKSGDSIFLKYFDAANHTGASLARGHSRIRRRLTPTSKK